MKKILLITLVLVSLTGYAQTGVVRLEFEAALNSDIYKLIPLGNRGFLVLYETKEEVGNVSKNWLFAYYDPTFTEVWKTNIAVVKDAEYMDYFGQDSLFYLFFLNPGKVKSITSNFQLLTLDLEEGVSYTTTGTLPSESDFIKFLVNGDNAFIALDLKSEEAAVYSLNLRSGTINEFQVPYPDQNMIDDLAFDPYQNEILITVSNYLSHKQNKSYLISLDMNANFLRDMEIQPAANAKYLNKTKVYIADSSLYMLVGTYGNISSKMPSSTDYFGLESAGVFSTWISHQKQKFMNYYNFMEFSNLRAGVSARDFYRVQRKKDREATEASLNYELLVHEPVMHDSSLVLMLEAYYPEFRTVSDISYDYWGRPVTHTYNVFDGYHFFDAILTGFNLKGELTWDNSLEVNMSSSTALNYKSGYYFDGKPELIFYNDGSKIAYRVCLKNAELEPYTKLEIETPRKGDKVTAVGQNNFIHWYDQYFLAYGYQTIRNNMVTEKNERTVFYINKIALE